jgi:hypothetical protein
MVSYSKVKEVKRAQEQKLLKTPNVIGVGIGRKLTDGVVTDELSLKVYVEEKVAESRLKARQIVPKTIDDVATDVVAIGRIHFQYPRNKNRPACGGDSIGSCHSLVYGYISAGTLGVALIDKTDGKRVLLSNNHVLANCDIDSEHRANAGDPIVQPGTLDGGSCATDLIGTLKRWVPFNSAGLNEIDAAIASLNTESDAQECSICCSDIGRVNGYRALGEEDLGLDVQKCGRTTGYTSGTVQDVDATVNIHYEVLTPGGIVDRTIQFTDQILLTSMSDSGDSGSLILDMNEKAVGLLFAGSTIVTIANRIEKVLSILNLEFCPRIELCRIGGPHPPCTTFGPIQRIRCKTGGPIPLCIVGGPGSTIHCLSGLPDSPLTCKTGGPGILIQCASGPDIRVFDPKNPIVDPERFVIIKEEAIPPSLKKSFENMLKKITEEK